MLLLPTVGDQLTAADRAPRLPVHDPQITGIEVGDQRWQPFVAQVMDDGHRHIAISADDQWTQRAAEGRQSCPPVMFVGDRRMDFLDTGRKFNR
jgi:hypothetical protein